MTSYPFIPHPTWHEFPVEEMRHRSTEFLDVISQRRTVREFSDRPVPRDVIENALADAGTAPSGANLQPWHFSVVSNAAIKEQIREAAEVEEREFYEHRASPEWLAALEPLGTDSNKPFLEVAPCLIAVFLKKFGKLPDGRKVKHSRRRIDRARIRHTHHRTTYGGPGLPHPYTQSHEIPEQYSASAGE